MKPVKLIDEQGALEDAADALAGNDRVYVDTEFESNRRGTTLCLVQLCTDDSDVYLVDAIALSDLSPLKKVLGRKRVEWVMHAGRQDVELLMEALGLRYKPRVFDTQVAWALQSPEHQVSLAYLQAGLLGLVPEKGLQTDDWTRRPLSDEHQKYAADDVAHLPAIYTLLSENLTAKGHLDLVGTISGETLDPPAEPVAPLNLSAYRNLWQLTGRQRAALEWMIEWYNGLEGDALDRAPHKKALFSVAARLPETKTALRSVKGVPRRFADKEGGEFVEQMQAAIADVEDTPADGVPPPYATFDEMYREALLRCAQADVCAAVQIAPELAFPSWLTRQLRDAISHGDDFTKAGRVFGGWRNTLRGPWEAFCKGVGLAG